MQKLSAPISNLFKTTSKEETEVNLNENEHLLRKVDCAHSEQYLVECEKKTVNNKERLHNITDKLFSAFRITNNKKKEHRTKKHEGKKARKEHDDYGQSKIDLKITINTKHKTHKSHSINSSESGNDNETVEETSVDEHGNDWKIRTITGKLNELNNDYDKQMLQERLNIKKMAGLIKNEVKKTSGRRLDDDEIEEIVDSIIKVEIWLKEHSSLINCVGEEK